MWGNRRGGNEHFIFRGIDAVPLYTTAHRWIRTAANEGRRRCFPPTLHFAGFVTLLLPFSRIKFSFPLLLPPVRSLLLPAAPSSLAGEKLTIHMKQRGKGRRRRRRRSGRSSSDNEGYRETCVGKRVAFNHGGGMPLLTVYLSNNTWLDYNGRGMMASLSLSSGRFVHRPVLPSRGLSWQIPRQGIACLDCPGGINALPSGKFS